MKVAIFIDKQGSAIDRLSQSIARHNSHWDVRVIPFHPKRPDELQKDDARKALEWCDLIMVSYWKSGDLLRGMFPTQMQNKPSILCHHNPYDLGVHNWTDMYNEVVVSNSDIHTRLPYAHIIPLGIDLDFFKYNEDYTDKKVVNMVVGRIESNKGVAEVAQACNELGYKFLLVGKISSREYMDQVLELGGDNIEFRENVSDDELLNAYYESAIHVCNSKDNFESGTMPILEAMACGVPVLTRRIGHIPDTFNGTNMVVREGAKEDIEDLKTQLKDLMENSMTRERIRYNAWSTVKTRTDTRMARSFSRLWYETINVAQAVSIVIPTKDPDETFVDVLGAAAAQTYPNIELVIVDSSPKPYAERMIKILKANTNVNIKYITTEDTGYTLPKARNIGVTEAEGKYIMLCDDRIKMKPNAVEELVPYAVNDTWAWGVKDDYPKSFVENFSMVRRSTLLKHGMFNERIDSYGGATQDIRERYEKRGGINFQIADKAKAYSIKKSGNKWNKREDIIKAKDTLHKLYG